MAQINHFGNTLYRNKAEMLEGIAESWFSKSDVGEIDPRQEAESCIETYILDNPCYTGDFSHMTLNDYTVTDLADAMLTVAKRLDESPET